MKHVVVDPITRIEGHLRVEIQVDEATGKVTDAISSGTAWRGLELVMNDRDPRDAWAYIQRICGVCTSSHALGCLRAVEDAFGITIPKNAHYIRNIIAACLGHQDHIIHFYHLHALDWVSPLEALKADPAATAALQNTVLATYRLPFRGPQGLDTEAYPHDFPVSNADYYAAIQAKVQKIVESGQLGIFSAQWWDHPDYQLLPPEVHLMAISHYLEMLDKQKDLVVPHVVFGGKNPHPHYCLGGMPCSISMEDGNAPINAARLAIVEHSINQARHMMNDYYLPDVLAAGHLYVQKGYTSGGGLAKKRVLGFGMFPEEPFSGAANGDFFKNLLVRCNGVVEDFAEGVMKAKVYDFTEKDLTDTDGVAESVEHGWYEYKGGDDKALHPWEGETTPHYTEPKEGTKTEWKALNEQGKYSWLKTPKWRGKLCEVGPLARYIVLYTKAKQGLLGELTWAEKMIVDQIDAVTKLLNVPVEAWLPSTVGRTAARALDAQLQAEVSKYFFDKLVANIKSGDTKVANTEKWEPSTWPKEAKGVGLYEAPRGALSHWAVIKDGKITNYQAVVPTTWNACPRDDAEGHGAYEMSMRDTPVKVADKPLEIVKAVRSFDPCMACSTHLFNAKGEKIRVVTTDPYAGVTVDE